MTKPPPLVASFLSLLLLLCFACFYFPSSNPHRTSPNTKKKKKKNSLRNKTTSALSFLKRVFTRTKPDPETEPDPTPSLSFRSSALPESLDSGRPLTRSRPGSDILSDPIFFPLRNDIYPCPTCGEIFQNPNVLEHHQAVKHAVSELYDGDTGKNIVQIIFKTGWPDNKPKRPGPIIHRVLKIHTSRKTLARFEEYRERVKMRASRNGALGRSRDERCVADGNELLRFHCTTFICDLGKDGRSYVCNGQYCNVCGIIKSGFSPKMDGISTSSSSWRANGSVPEDIEEEFGFMNVKRAMLVCRVIAGRVECEPDLGCKEDPGFDSVVGSGGGPGCWAQLDGDDELLVFDPRAVLPCFVIVYTV